MKIDELEIMQKNAYLKYNNALKKMKKSCREMDRALADMECFGEIAIENGLEISDFVKTIKSFKDDVRNFENITKI